MSFGRMADLRLKLADRFAIVALNIAANITPISPCGRKCETGGHISSLIRIREMGPNRVQVWVNNAHGHRRNKPKKGSEDKESGTQKSHSLGSAFVFNAEVSLGHCRRV